LRNKKYILSDTILIAHTGTLKQTLNIDSHGRLTTLHVCDKRDAFNFAIVNFPFLCSNIPLSAAYDVHISQFLWYVRAYVACMCQNFPKRGQLLTKKFMLQDYNESPLKSSFYKLYWSYNDLVSDYKLSLMCFIPFVRLPFPHCICSCVIQHTVNVENITVFLISLYSRFDNFPRILSRREYSVIYYIFYLLFFWIGYSGASLIWTPLIRMLHYPDDISGEQTLWKSIQMWFIYPDASFIRTILLGTKVSGLTRLDCTCFSHRH
jgi:hypothetical protein